MIFIKKMTMKRIIKLNESDLERIIRRSLREMEGDDIDMRSEKRFGDMKDKFKDEYEDEYEDEYPSEEERQDFIDYVCGFKKDWCSKTKRFFSEMV